MPEPAGAVYLVTPGGARARGGIGRMVATQARHWPEHGRRLRIVDSFGPGPRWRMPAYFCACLARLLIDGWRGRIGLVHVNMTERLSVCRKGVVVMLARGLGIPVIVHLHGADFAAWWQAAGAGRRRLVRGFLRRAGAVIVLGDFWHRFVVGPVGLDPARVLRLANAVADPQAGRPPARAGTGAAAATRILFLGVVSVRKGAGVLLEALADPVLAGLAWTAVLAGNGEVETYRDRAAALGLGDRVRFTGWIDEAGVRDRLAEADMLVLPSRNEGLPMAILEAMAAGLPVIATAVGSVADAVIPEVTGLLVPVGDAPALALALRRLILDPALRRRLGAAGREAFLERFEIGGHIATLTAVYDAVARGELPVVPGDGARS